MAGVADVDRQAGRQQLRVAGRERHRRIDAGAQVQAGAAGGGVGGQLLCSRGSRIRTSSRIIGSRVAQPTRAEQREPGSGVIAGRSRIASAISAKPPIISQRLSRKPTHGLRRSASALPSRTPDALSRRPRGSRRRPGAWRRRPPGAALGRRFGELPAGCAAGSPAERGAGRASRSRAPRAIRRVPACAPRRPSGAST